MTGAAALVVRDVALPDGTRADVRCGQGRITSVGAARTTAGPADAALTLEGAGALLLPALVVPDLHLDKVFLRAELLGRVEPEAARPGADWSRVWGPGARHPLGVSALERAHGVPRSVLRALAERCTAADVAARAARVARMALAHGVRALRAFGDVAPALGLTAIEGLLDVRARFRNVLALQVAPFPQEGLGERRTRELMDEAMRIGADVVGGNPGAEAPSDVDRHIAACFDLAERHRAPVHMLIDDTVDPASRALERLARETVARGFAGRVCASNCIALAFYGAAHAGAVIEQVARAGISVVSNPHVNLIDAGALLPAPGPRTVTLIPQLAAAGVNVALGQDDVDDVYYPWGQADPLEVAFLASHAIPLHRPGEVAALLDMVTGNAARAIGLPADAYPYRLAPGAPADLVLVRAPTWHEALQYRPADRMLVVAGRVVARTETHREVRER